jgi:3-aminobutyryl-CoA ammonia-lyase
VAGEQTAGAQGADERERTGAQGAGGQPVSARIRVRVGAEDIHYSRRLAAGAYCLKLFGDLATEITIRTDGHGGLLRAYERVEFLAPVRAGDFVEAHATLEHRGASSRRCRFEAHKVIEGSDGPHARVLDPPLLVARALGTTVVPQGEQSNHEHSNDDREAPR